MSGYWQDDIHYCPDGHETVYQLFSGGREWWCNECDYSAFYPEKNRPESPAKMLADGRIDEFRKVINEELEKRKKQYDKN